MRLAPKIIIGFLAVVTSVVIIWSVLIFELNQIETPSNDLQTSTSELSKILELNDLAVDMKYYDEVLTQSARNYAFTHDAMWKNRYKTSEPELDQIIKRSIELGDETDREFFASIDNANRALVEMEYSSIKLVDQGKSSEAVKILESTQYWELKRDYADGLGSYIARHAELESGALGTHTQSISSLGTKMQTLASNAIKILLVAIPVLLGMAAIFIVMISIGVSKPVSSLTRAVKNIANGNFGIEIKINGNDEMHALAESFNQMSRQLKEYTRKIELDKAKDEFMAMISHELKTPLVPITGYIGLLLADKYGELNTKQRERLLTVQSSVKSLLKLISDLLDAQKIELGKLRLHVKDEDLGKLVLDTIEKTRPDADRMGIVISSDIQEMHCICDKTRVEQVISNILLNSLDFCKKHIGRIHVSAKLEGGLAHIIINDNGVGMTKEKISKLFTKFYQGDNTMTREHGGTGLGLAVCKGIVENHGGRIWLDSEGIGNGTVVHILLSQASTISKRIQIVNTV